MRTVIVGLGNPVLSDDGLGIHAARALREVLPADEEVDVREAYAGGLRVVEAIAGYDRAVIVDALWSGEVKPGTIVRLSLDDLRRSRNALSLHDLDLPTALALGAMTGLHVPPRIEFWGVEVGDARTFSEFLTAPVQESLPVVVAQVRAYVASGFTAQAEEACA